jgi:hypothetical protein
MKKIKRKNPVPKFLHQKQKEQIGDKNLKKRDQKKENPLVLAKRKENPKKIRIEDKSLKRPLLNHKKLI